MKPISEIAAQLGIDPQKLIMYGDFKAKIPLDTISNKKTGIGKLIVVTGHLCIYLCMLNLGTRYGPIGEKCSGDS